MFECHPFLWKEDPFFYTIGSCRRFWVKLTKKTPGEVASRSCSGTRGRICTVTTFKYVGGRPRQSLAEVVWNICVSGCLTWPGPLLFPPIAHPPSTSLHPSISSTHYTPFHPSTLHPPSSTHFTPPPPPLTPAHLLYPSPASLGGWKGRRWRGGEEGSCIVGGEWREWNGWTGWRGWRVEKVEGQWRVGRV